MDRVPANTHAMIASPTQKERCASSATRSVQAAFLPSLSRIATCARNAHRTFLTSGRRQTSASIRPRSVQLAHTSSASTSAQAVLRIASPARALITVSSVTRQDLIHSSRVASAYANVPLAKHQSRLTMVATSAKPALTLVSNARPVSLRHALSASRTSINLVANVYQPAQLAWQRTLRRCSARHALSVAASAMTSTRASYARKASSTLKVDASLSAQLIWKSQRMAQSARLARTH